MATYAQAHIELQKFIATETESLESQGQSINKEALEDNMNMLTDFVYQGIVAYGEYYDIYEDTALCDLFYSEVVYG